MTYIDDPNDPATILADAETFFSLYFADTDGDEVENVEVVAGLRRGQAEPGDDRFERGPHAMLPRRRPRRSGISLVLRR